MYRWFKLDCSQIPLAGLSGIATKCFLALAACMSDSQRVNCTYQQLSQSLGISRRTAIRAVSELEKADLLVNESQPGVCLSIVIKKGATVGRNSDQNNHTSTDDPKWKRPDSANPVTFTP